MALSGDTIEVDGWVILPLDARRPGHAYTTFGKTVTEAWFRHIGQAECLHDKQQRIREWSARGYGPRRAKMTIEQAEG